MKKNQKEENELYGIDDVLDLKLSYSKLSSFIEGGAKALVKKKELTGDGVKEGGLIDCLLFTPDEMLNDYYIFDGIKPTATAGELCDLVFNLFTEIPTVDEVVEVSRRHGYWSKVVNPETYIKKFDTEDFWGYLKSQYSSKSKTIITTEQLQRAEEVVEILKSHAYSKAIVAFPTKTQSKYAQYKIEYRYKNVIFRGILDLLVIDHSAKTVQMIDLKTGAPVAEAFSQSFVKYRYYLQEAVYQHAFKKICEDLKLEGYTLLPFQFLYISRFEKLPLVYTVPQKWSEASVKGFTTKAGYVYKGMDQIISDITWHWTNQKFSLSRETYEKEGNLILNDDFIEVL